jgi:hypothetical protein
MPYSIQTRVESKEKKKGGQIRKRKRQLEEKKNENGKIINGNGKENEGALFDGKGNGRGNSRKINTENFRKYNLERPVHLVCLHLHMKLGLATYQVY